MEREFSEKFDKLGGEIVRLATMVAEGFAAAAQQVDARFEQVDARFEQVDVQLNEIRSDIRELRTEIRSIRAELERIPDNIDATYAKTLNDLLERVHRIEQKIGIAA